MSNPSHLLSSLNDPQAEAASHVQGPLLILAGAGSGKTRVITHRIAHLILEHNIAPHAILAVTFTNKAAHEMRERVEQLLHSSANTSQPTISTFHSLCARLLRQHGAANGIPKTFAIADDSDQTQALKHVVQKLELETSTGDLHAFWSAIEHAKHNALTPKMYIEQHHGSQGELCGRVYRAYQRYLRSNGMLDFGDLIAETVWLLQSCPDVRRTLQKRWSFVMVDEFQDTNVAQSLLIELLTQESRNLVVVGDDDQAIYSWRGATVRNILDFESSFPEANLVRLEQNYRSSQIILDAAWGVIERVHERRPKKLWSERKDGPLLQCFTGNTAREEAMWIARTIQRLVGSGQLDYSDCAVFYRTNVQSRVLEEQFQAYGLRYDLIGGVSFYERREVKDILTYLQVAINPHNDLALLRIINTPRRKIGKKTLAKLRALVGSGGVAESLFDAVDYVARAHGGTFAPSVRSALGAFLDLIDELRFQIEQNAAPGPLVQTIIEQTDYLHFLERSDPSSFLERQENLDALVHALSDPHHAPDLTTFLENAVLHREQQPEDELHAQTHIHMMTVHASKGLEFEAVFVCGLEEGLFPLIRKPESLSEHELQERIDEERRLFYVALTRARTHLYVSNSLKRMQFGKQNTDSKTQHQTYPSSFLKDIPEHLIEIAQASARDQVIWADREKERARQKRMRERAMLAGPPTPVVVRNGIEYDVPPESWEISQLPQRAPKRTKRRAQPQPETSYADIEYEPEYAVEYDHEHSAPRTQSRSKRTLQGELGVGATVAHPSEGIGKVLSVDGDGPRATIRVRFLKSGQERAVMRQFLKVFAL